MSRQPLRIVLGAVCACLGWGAPLTILNHSFELAAVGTPGGGSGIVTDWTVSSGGNSGVLRPDSTQVSGSPNPLIPDGLQVLQVFSGSRFQTLTDVFMANTLYTLTVAVGQRLDFPLSSYSFTLEAGANVLATASGPPGAIPPSGGFVDVQLTFLALPGDPNLGQPITIRLSHLSGTNDIFALYDNVRLDASPANLEEIPEPGASLLVISALGMFALWRVRGKTVTV